MISSVLPVSISRLLRSFVFTLLAISAPFFLIHEGYSALQIGIVIAISGVSSTIFVYVFPRINIPIRWILISLWALLFFSLFFLSVFQDATVYVISLAAGGIPLSGKDMSANQALEQYSIGKNASSQRAKAISYGYYNFLSYGGNTIASALLLFYSGISFRDIFYLSLAISLFSGVPYLFYRFPEHSSRSTRTEISPETGKLRNELATLFSLDSFAGGLVNASMLSLWFLLVYSTSLADTGFIFVVVNILSAVSVLISGRLSTSFGLVRTMVYTHLLSNGFLILMAVFHSLLFSEIMLFARQTTSQMDVPPRDTFINTIIPEKDRITTNSQFIAARNTSIIPAPAAGGALLEILPSAIPEVAGGLKALYDVVFFLRFRQYRT